MHQQVAVFSHYLHQYLTEPSGTISMKLEPEYNNVHTRLIRKYSLVWNITAFCLSSNVFIHQPRWRRHYLSQSEVSIYFYKIIHSYISGYKQSVGQKVNIFDAVNSNTHGNNCSYDDNVYLKLHKLSKSKFDDSVTLFMRISPAQPADQQGSILLTKLVN